MCEFCDPRPRAGPIDMTMGDNRSFQFFSMAAIDEAIRQTTKAGTVCDQHRSMFCIPVQQAENDEHDTEEADGEGDDEEDGT